VLSRVEKRSRARTTRADKVIPRGGSNLGAYVRIGSIATEMGRLRYVRLSPDSDRRADMARGLKSAKTLKSSHLQVMLALARTADVVRRDRQVGRFPDGRSCRTRRKLAVSAPRVERLSLLICPTGRLSIRVSIPLCKNISVFDIPKSHLELFASRPARGAYRDRHGRWDGMRWTRQRFAREVIAGRVERLVSDQQHADEECLLRTAKSCGPDAPTLASSSRRHVGPTGLRHALIR
jgi:hypothetical protein